MEYKVKQAPIQSPYGHFTKSMEAVQNVDLSDKIAIVTGGYTGIGLWTTKALEKVGARVILVGSRGHRWGGVLFDDPNFLTTEYTPNRAYAASKSALSLFAVRLDELAHKDNIRAFAVHPGPIPSSDLFAESIVGLRPSYFVALRRFSAKLMRGLHITELLNAFRRPQIENAFKTIQQGAATPVWCATSSLLNGIGGVYCEDCNIASPVPADSNAPHGVRPWAIDPGQAKKLWELGEEMTGIQFKI